VIYFFGEPYLPFKLDELFRAATVGTLYLITVGVNSWIFHRLFHQALEGFTRSYERLEKEKSQVQLTILRISLTSFPLQCFDFIKWVDL
jgi:hypothetical protein